MHETGDGPRVRGADATQQETFPTVPHPVPEQLGLPLGVEPVATAYVEWRDDALDVVARLAAAGDAFTAEDVRRDLGGLAPGDDNWWGLMIAEAHRRGLVVPLGYVRATRRARRRSVLGRWVAPRWGAA